MGGFTPMGVKLFFNIHITILNEQYNFQKYDLKQMFPSRTHYYRPNSYQILACCVAPLCLGSGAVLQSMVGSWQTAEALAAQMTNVICKEERWVSM